MYKTKYYCLLSLTMSWWKRGSKRVGKVRRWRVMLLICWLITYIRYLWVWYFLFTEPCSLFFLLDYAGGATASGTIVLSFPLPGCLSAYRFSTCIWLCGFAGKELPSHNGSIPLIFVLFFVEQVKMYAEFATSRLIDFLRASSSYSLEMVSRRLSFLLIMFLF